MFKKTLFVGLSIAIVAAVFAALSMAVDNGVPRQLAEVWQKKTLPVETRHERNPVQKQRSIAFEAVPVPVTDAAKRAVTTSNNVKIEDRDWPIGYHVITRSGQKVGSEVFGRLVDRNGRALKGRGGADIVSHNADFTSLFQRGNKFYSITHFEAIPGAMYLTRLEKDNAGNFKANRTNSIDFSTVGGIWGPCAGVVTPWNTHLGGEESPPDGRAVDEWEDSLRNLDSLSSGMLRYFGIDRNDPGMTLDRIRTAFNPYSYGYAVEVTVDERGDTSVRKHYAMGRISMELAYIMPDRRTVYLSDDGKNGGFFMFIADRMDDLSSGRLFAAKWSQKDDKNGGHADLDWVPLGHATHDDVAEAIRRRIRFSDMFDVTQQMDEACPPGMTSIVGNECLRLKPGMATPASRLETRRYAAVMGATTEFSKPEGITFDPGSKTLYLAMATLSRSMEDYENRGTPKRKYDAGGPNHIRLPYNKCGAVYGMNVSPDAKIGSKYVAKSMGAVLTGDMKSYPKNSKYTRNNCAVDRIANPDNLTFMRGYGMLIISEDSDSGHQNDAVWAYDVKTQKLTRIQTTPYGAEATSPYWYPNLDGRGYLVSVVQHPFGESDGKLRKDSDEAGAYVGYFGPFPPMD